MDAARIGRLIGRQTIVLNETRAEELVRSIAASKSMRTIGFLNAHGVNLVSRDGEALERFEDLDILLRDGAGLKILHRLLRVEAGLNMNGTDLIPRVAAAARGRRVALFGTRDPYLAKAAQHVRALGCEVAAVEDGFQSDRHYADVLAKTPCDLVVLGMGMPRQEACAAFLKRETDHRGAIICGGAILDFWGGKTPRAPALMRRTGTEWLFRLALEPRRLFGRYVLGNGVFLARAVRLAMAGVRPDPERLA